MAFPKSNYGNGIYAFHKPHNSAKKLGGGIRGMEIGVWYGKGSTQIWLKRAPASSEILLIDSWKPYASNRDLVDDTAFDYKEMDDLTTDAFKSAFLEIKKIEMGRLQDNLAISLLRGDSASFLKYLKDDSYDFIYIDGDHKYEKVKADIQESKRLINKEFGLICGDDLEKLPSGELYQLAKQHPERDCLREPYHFHPGVMAAIYEEFDEVNMINGFWWIVIADGKFQPALLKSTPQQP